MRCPHLVKDVIYTCSSGEGAAIPASVTLKRYCKDDRFNGCPNFRAREGSRAFYCGLETAA